MKISGYLPLLLAPCALITAAPSCVPSVDRSNLTVALVRTPPPNWPMPFDNIDYRGLEPNMTETVTAGIELIKMASGNGANLIAFPELWFPGHPKGSLDDDYFTKTYLPQYADNAIVIGGPEWNRLTAAVREAGIYAQINFAERDGDHIYMSQSLIAPSGDVLLHRRKVRPSGSERDIFTDGTTDGLQVIRTAYGRWGMLECFEHFWPSMTFNMHVQQEALHIAAYPFLQDSHDPTSPWFANDVVNQGVMSTYSVHGRTWSLTPAVGSTFIHNPTGIMVAHISANASFEEHPILYHDIDTSQFDDKTTYDVDWQFSWGVLQQVVDSFPAYVPKVEGSLVPFRSVSIKDVLNPGKAGQTE